MKPLDNVKDQEFESDFEEMHDTGEEIDNLYNARDIVMNRMVKDEYYNMDENKWNDIVEDAIHHGIMKDTKECEAILEDMLSWDKLLPVNKGQRSWSHADGGRPIMGGCWLVALESSGGRWPTATGGRRWPMATCGRRWPGLLVGGGRRRLVGGGRRWWLARCGHVA